VFTFNKLHVNEVNQIVKQTCITKMFVSELWKHGARLL